VQSEVGTGTTFTVTLPITPPPELAHDGGEAAA
jgi:signal transduction histidine kinase